MVLLYSLQWMDENHKYSHESELQVYLKLTGWWNKTVSKVELQKKPPKLPLPVS